MRVKTEGAENKPQNRMPLRNDNERVLVQLLPTSMFYISLNAGDVEQK